MSYSTPAFLSFKGENKQNKELKNDERGLAFSLPIILAVILGIVGISIGGAVSYKFIVILMGIVISLIGIGSLFFTQIPGKYGILAGVAGVGLVVVFGAGILTGLGFLVLGIGGYMIGFVPGPRYLYAGIGLVGAGIIIAIYGQTFAIETLGVLP